MNLVTNPIPVADADWTPGREGTKPEYIILHTTDGTAASADQAFHTPNAGKSAHRVVGLDGTITVEVSDGDTSWGAANWPVNLAGFNLEHADNGNYADAVRTDAMYEASGWQVADWCRRFGIPCKKVDVDANHMPVEAGIVLHREVSQLGTGCPDGLDWERCIREAQAVLGGEAPAPVAVQTSSTPAGFIPQNTTVTVTTQTLRVHESPDASDAGNFANTADGMLHQGNVATITGYIQGQDPYGDGRNVWLRSLYGRWFWAGGTNFTPQSINIAVAPAAPTPVPVTEAPAVPEWVSTYKADKQVRNIQVEVVAHDFEGKGPDSAPIAPGTAFQQAGTFSVQGTSYARSQWSSDNNRWYGVAESAFQAPVAAVVLDTTQPAVAVNNGAPVITDISAPVVTQAAPGSATVDPLSAVPPTPANSELTVGNRISAIFAAIYGAIIKLLPKNKKETK